MLFYAALISLLFCSNFVLVMLLRLVNTSNTSVYGRAASAAGFTNPARYGGITSVGVVSDIVCAGLRIVWQNSWLVPERTVIYNGVIMKTSPCNEQPPTTPLLYSKTGVYRGIHFFLIFALKHRFWVLVRTAAVLTCTHSQYFEQH